jgi:hypothetical protein
MPQYYFDLRQDGEASRDDEGMELRDFQAVQEVAARSLTEMALMPSAAIPRILLAMTWRSTFAMQPARCWRSRSL